MKPDRWRQVDELYAAALERRPEERAAFLDAACAGDSELRREVEEMLGSDAQAQDFIETPVIGLAVELLAGRAGKAAADGRASGSSPTSDSIDDARFVPGEMLAGRYRVVGLLSLVHGLGFILLLLLLSLLLRGEWRTAVGAWVLFSAALLAAGAANPFEILANVLLAAAYVFVATRFGLLAVTAAQFALFMTEFYPFTTDFTAWYAGAALFALGVVAALAAYAFHTALAGQPLVPRRILEG